MKINEDKPVEPKIFGKKKSSNKNIELKIQDVDEEQQKKKQQSENNILNLGVVGSNNIKKR